jgi:hypothetical protein
MAAPAREERGISVHARVSVSGLCFPGLSAVDAIGAIAALGVAATLKELGA